MGSGWKTLPVINYVDRNVIRIALQIAIIFVKIDDPEKSHSIHQLVEYLNTTVELLEAAHTLWKEAIGYAAKRRGVLLVAFLWTSWHRSLILFLSYRLQYQLTVGFDANTANYGLNTPTFATALSSTPDHPGISPYMCKWAYEVLRTDRSSIGLDFRTFHERYTEYAKQYGHADPRCNRADDGHSVQCDGRAPENCMRFKGQTITDQSAHGAGCAGYCSKMHWDSESYGKASGGRAVLVDADTSDNRLRYCSTTEKTLTISHVWSHGQEGRPEMTGTGFNRCLHDRYCRIARVHGCESYWMDTPCIPTDQVLRKEAINEINDTFQASKMTLVCDRDLMEIDVTDVTDMSPQLQECILAALLVSDWNVRAWTFLEAMRGRANLCLLCRDDAVVPLKTILATVNREGSLDLAVLFLTAQHLTPSRDLTKLPKIVQIDPWTWHMAKGFIASEEAACLHSRRYATRPMDEVVIWSLLCGKDALHTPGRFLAGKESRSIYSDTGGQIWISRLECASLARS